MLRPVIRGSLQPYLWQISDIHLHVAALTGPVQPLHVHIQRPDTQNGIHRIGKEKKSTDRGDGYVSRGIYLSLGT